MPDHSNSLRGIFCHYLCVSDFVMTFVCSQLCSLPALQLLSSNCWTRWTVSRGSCNCICSMAALYSGAWDISLLRSVLSLSGIATCTHRPQGVITVGIPHVLKYLLFIIIIVLQQKGVMQTNGPADVELRHFCKTSTVRRLQAFSSASLFLL